MSDAVAQESVELLLVSGLLEAEVAVPEEWLPQVHGEVLRRDHKGRGVLLLSGCYGNIENTKMFCTAHLLFKMLTSGCEGNCLGQAMGWRGGGRCLREAGLRVQASPTSLHQLHLSPPAGGLTSYPIGATKAIRHNPSQLPHINEMHPQSSLFPSGPLQATLSSCADRSPSPRKAPCHQVCSVPCTLSLLPVTCLPAINPCSHLSLVPATPAQKSNC